MRRQKARVVEHRGKWAVYINRKRYSTGLAATGDNRASAERTAREFRAALQKKLAGETCGGILQAYLDDMPRRANAKTVSSPYVYAKKAVAAFFSEHLPEQVTRDECRAYVEKRRAEGKADGTIRKEIDILKAALRWFDPHTPARFDAPSPGRPRERWLTREEFRRLLEAAHRTHIKTFLHVAICTGARKAAILDMTWDTHINFERRTIWPGFKPGGKNRAAPILMTGACYEWLRQQRERAETPWVVEYAGEKVLDVKKGLLGAYGRAGLVDIHAPAHVLRHTAGAWMAMGDVERGVEPVPLLEISKRLGHSSPAVTYSHYAHLSPTHMAASTRALEL